ncbi:hypothetical protein WMY93_000087 [Mugilogobius chulae]|uniref:Uncharacterized protein n=1 Tax=Mugilogobius chulae TaxID=88201 RepID=A0AAW0QD97_9GOBI
MHKWRKDASGEAAFRESLARLGELRCIVREGIPVLALTTFVETKNRHRIAELLHMEDAVQVTVSPNRPNTRLGLSSVSDDGLSCLDWIVTMIKNRELSSSTQPTTDDATVKDVIDRAANGCFRQALYRHFEENTATSLPDIHAARFATRAANAKMIVARSQSLSAKLSGMSISSS